MPSDLVPVVVALGLLAASFGMMGTLAARMLWRGGDDE